MFLNEVEILKGFAVKEVFGLDGFWLFLLGDVSDAVLRFTGAFEEVLVIETLDGSLGVTIDEPNI